METQRGTVGQAQENQQAKIALYRKQYVWPMMYQHSLGQTKLLRTIKPLTAVAAKISTNFLRSLGAIDLYKQPPPLFITQALLHPFL